MADQEMANREMANREMANREMANREMIERHRKTWQGFVKLTTYSVAAVTIIMLLMAAFLT